MSAGMPGPLPIIFSDEPGIDKQLRRGKSRERGDISKFYIFRDYIALFTSAITSRCGAEVQLLAGTRH